MNHYLNDLTYKMSGRFNVRFYFKSILIVGLLSLVFTQVYSQTILTAKGIVVDEKGEPIIGASVVIKGSAQGTITNFDGNFLLKIPEGSILKISFIGYTSLELPVVDDKMFEI